MPKHRARSRNVALPLSAGTAGRVARDLSAVRTRPRRIALVALVALVVGSFVSPGQALASPTPPQRYVASWSGAYTAFARAYVDAYRPCAGGPTRACARAQQLAARAASAVESILASSTPPAALARDVARLARDLDRAGRALAASALAARAGRSSARVFCSAEQGPCTAPTNDIVNVIGDIEDLAGVNLPLPA